jgi:hypothetical protein
MKKLDYYYIYNRYYNTERDLKYEKFSKIYGSGHIIRATSKTNALAIVRKYKIANSFGRKVKKRTIHLITDEMNKEPLLYRHRLGIGGYIWFEENNELKHE